VGISNPEECGGDFLVDLFHRQPIGIPLGEFVVELVEGFEEGSMNREMEEWRLDCIAEIRERIDRLEALIKGRMPEE
jgi:hypothetical protein